MEANPLLESHLKALRLPGFLHNYRKYAEDAAHANRSYDRYPLSLAVGCQANHPLEGTWCQVIHPPLCQVIHPG